MTNIRTIYTELETAIALAKCQKCGCMQDTLDNLQRVLPTLNGNDIPQLAHQLPAWIGQMQPLRYTCLGCEHCYPAVAQNTLIAAFPTLSELSLACGFQIAPDRWPPVVGDYFVLDKSAPVAVSTLANVELAETLAGQKPAGLALVGKTETENIGLDKIIKNVISNPAIQYLVLVGKESKGHLTGQTLLALAANGVDERGRVIGSPGKQPFLRNVSVDEVDAFRRQVQVLDMIGCDQPELVVRRIAELDEQIERCGSDCGCAEPFVTTAAAPAIVATEPNEPVKLDKEGYFVITPLADQGKINVEHYAYDNTLLRTVEGESARGLYKTIVSNGWVSELSHAAYLGRELTRAELAMKFGFKYVQDGA